MKREVFAPGKIILSGEHAVVAGYPGIAVPSTLGITAEYEQAKSCGLTIALRDDLAHPLWNEYIRRIAAHSPDAEGKLTLNTTLPIGKGMGSSTAAVIAVSRALHPDVSEKKVQSLENALSPNNSGIDFAVIWNTQPMQIIKRIPSPASLQKDILRNAYLIDTGTPNEPTANLVAWVQEHREENKSHFETIAECTKEIIDGSSLIDVLPKHHRAQVAMGVVTEEAQQLIAKIEESGGAGKVLGAGARTGGGGMVLAIHEDEKVLRETVEGTYTLLSL